MQQADHGKEAAAIGPSAEATNHAGAGANGGNDHVGSGPAKADANKANAVEPHHTSGAPASGVLADSAGEGARIGQARAGTRADSTSKPALAAARAGIAVEGVAKDASATRADAGRHDSASSASARAKAVRGNNNNNLSRDEESRAHLLDVTVTETKQQLPNGFWVPSR